MKVEKGSQIKCCVCGEKAVERSFDGTGWCQIHLSDWQAFLENERKKYDSLDAAFNAWVVKQDFVIVPKRRWEILIWPKIKHWHFRIAVPFGKGIPFLHETWLGPVCYRLWKDPRSVSSVSKAVRIVTKSLGL